MTRDFSEEIDAIELVLNNLTNMPKVRIVVEFDGKEVGSFTLRQFEGAVLSNGGKIYGSIGGYDGEFFTHGIFATGR